MVESAKHKRLIRNRKVIVILFILNLALLCIFPLAYVFIIPFEASSGIWIPSYALDDVFGQFVIAPYFLLLPILVFVRKKWILISIELPLFFLSAIAAFWGIRNYRISIIDFSPTIWSLSLILLLPLSFALLIIDNDLYFARRKEVEEISD